MPTCRSLVLALLLLLPGAAEAAEPVRPVVVFLPGFMGSDLYKGDDKLWQRDDPKRVAAGLAELVIRDGPRAPDDGVEPRPSPVYEPFLEALRAEATVVSFPYDWRQSNLASAAALDRFLAETPETRDAASVTLVAHSMGGLVALLFAQEVGGPYPSRAKLAKTITLGTPYLGSVQTVAMTFRDRGALPRKQVRADHLQVLMNSFPSYYEMLPSYLDGPGGLPCCAERGRPERRQRILELWTWEGWNTLQWYPRSYRSDAVKAVLQDGAEPIREAALRWRLAMPGWLFPIAGLADLRPQAPDGAGLSGTTSVAFVAFDGWLHTGDSECGGASITCSYGDQVVPQFSATLGRASDRVGPADGSCSIALGQGPQGPYYHSDMMDDPRVRATVLAALKASSNDAAWCPPR